MSDDSEQKFECCVCGERALQELEVFRSLRRVTSDCRPWPASGRMGVCATCGCAQSLADAAFIREIDEIYATYAIYHQSDGAEQRAFDAATGASSPRSERLLARFLQNFPLPQKGRLLDVGCGNGSTLQAFHALRPDWSLAGTELNEKCRRSVEAIAGAGAFHTCAPELVPGEFDVISMIHVLEHAIDPFVFLREIRSKLAPGGRLLVEVPGYVQNPFELLIADHRTHFDPSALSLLLRRADFHVELLTDEWVAKELTSVATAGNPNGAAASRSGSPNAPANRQLVERKLLWLTRIANAARELAKRGPLGIFGTSIAATWLAAELDGAAAFFVDEDQSRVGRQFMNRPILHPGEIAHGNEIFVALPTALAGSIAKRLTRNGVRYHVPPEE